MPNKSDFIAKMAKQLPPSASSLKLLDIGGVVGESLLVLRPDLNIELASLNWRDWHYPENYFDAVIAYDLLLKPELLRAILRLMRLGGRFILVNPVATVDETYVRLLESQNYVRLLIEPAHEGQGLLVRGEKAHSDSDTLARIQSTAQADADLLDLNSYKGRFLHLLVQQRPNKAVWAMRPDEAIHWQAITISENSQSYLLAFSSLPKAVNFMQAAVLENRIKDVNKMPKFKKEITTTWQIPICLNPSTNKLNEMQFSTLEIDPKTAEMPDE